jgi:hypothetical protein
MLEKQEGAIGEEGRDAAPRLPVSLSGEINAATRYAFTFKLKTKTRERRS